jgi:hypothetical protein
VREVTFHPLCVLFPLVEGGDFDDLVEDIQKHGLQEAIWTLGDTGEVLDGRNRYRACVEAGVEPVFRSWEGDPDEAVHFVVSQNLQRRHLSNGQRAILSARLMPLLRELAAKRQEASRAQPGEKAGTRKAPRNSGEPSNRHQRESAAEAGKLTGISADTARKGAKVESKGTPQWPSCAARPACAASPPRRRWRSSRRNPTRGGGRRSPRSDQGWADAGQPAQFLPTGFTAGKPDEILDLLAQVRRCGMRPHRQLLAAVRRISPRNTFLNATGS